MIIKEKTSKKADEFSEENLYRRISCKIPPLLVIPPPLFLQVCKWNFFEIFRHLGGGDQIDLQVEFLQVEFFSASTFFWKNRFLKPYFQKFRLRRSSACLRRFFRAPAALFRSACGALLAYRRLRRLDKQIFFCTSAFFRSVCKCFYYFSAKNLNTTVSSKICFLFFLSKNPTPTKRRLQTCTHSINTSTCRHVFQTFLLTTNTSNLIHVWGLRFGF